MIKQQSLLKNLVQILVPRIIKLRP